MDIMHRSFSGGTLDRPRRLRTLLRRALVILLAVFAMLMLVGWFYVTVIAQLHKERANTFAQFGDSLSDGFAESVKYNWTYVDVLRDQLADKTALDEEALFQQLTLVQNAIDTPDTFVIAFGVDGCYFASDGVHGNWSQSSQLYFNSEKQMYIAAIPHLGSARNFLMLIAPFDAPVGEMQLGHVAVLIDLEVVSRTFRIDNFGDDCYTYIIDKNGSRVYRTERQADFIDSYNILTALNAHDFRYSGSHAALRKAVREGEVASFAFDYFGEETYVAVSPMPDTAWMMLLFVPTEALAVSAVDFLQTIIIAATVAVVSLIAMLGGMMLFITRSRSQQLMLEQQEAMNARLREAADEANRANEAKTIFLSHMSHDIRTPINGIMGMIELARRDVDDRTRVLDCLVKMDGSAKHLLSLVNDVLDMSRIERGRASAASEPLQMGDLLENCCGIVRAQIEERGQILVCDLASASDFTVLGDELYLRQVFINILGNAVKFTPEGGRITFTARPEQLDDARVTLVFTIADTGIGMSESFVSHIWEPFAQEDHGAGTKYTGTGLGMSITHEFVHLMGGEITVESEKGKGSTFTVRIPFTRTSPIARVADVPPAIGGMRVLLVEDNELNLEIARELLAMEGVTVYEATNGREAVDFVQTMEEGEIDAILMDVMMPVMDGLAAARAIRAMAGPCAALPIIAMTANAFADDIRRTREAGMNAHLSKPIDFAMVVKTLAQFRR